MRWYQGDQDRHKQAGEYAVNVSKNIMYDIPRQTQTRAVAIYSACK